MSSIRPIEQDSVHRIQSGQVIVDLCSVAKELVENSIDAGATSIEVRFKNQGLDSIEVQDNGSGILESNFEAVALKHHTSKLATYSDLAALQTFGFRGEALSSMCALSHFNVVTCVASKAPRGSRLEFEPSGKLKNTAVVAAQTGTTVSVNNLFHNLPVRRRELERNIKREWNKVLALLNQYACIQVGVKFTVSQQANKGKRVVLFATKGNPTTRENIINVFGAKTASALLTISLHLKLQPSDGSRHAVEDAASQCIHVRGYVSRPVIGEGRQTPDRQMLFVNGRPCGLPQFAKVFNEVYRSYNSTQAPFIFADIQLDTRLYDVNVSPDKRTILLHEQNQMLENLREALIGLFEEQDYIVPVSQISRLRQAPLKMSTGNRKESTSITTGDRTNISAEEATEAESDAASRDILGDTGGTRHHTRQVSSRTRKPSAHRSSSPPELNQISPRVQMKSAADHPQLGNPLPMADDCHEPGLFSRCRRDGGSSRQPPAFSPTRDEELATTTLSPEARDAASSAQGDDKLDLEEKSLMAARRETGSANSPSPVDMRHSLPLEVIKSTSIEQNSAQTARPIANSRKRPAEEDSATNHRSPSLKLRRHDEDLQNPGVTNQPPSGPVPSFGGRLSQLFSADTSPDTSTKNLATTTLPSNESIEASSTTGSVEEVENLTDADPAVEVISPHPRGGSEEPQSQEQYNNVRKPPREDDNSNRTTGQENAVTTDLPGEEVMCLEKSEPMVKARPKKVATHRCVQQVRSDETSIRHHLTSWTTACLHATQRLSDTEQESGITVEDAEEKLSLTISKADFGCMKIVGQFNLGFIVAVRYGRKETRNAAIQHDDDEIFIIDQHATDEKYNFERLQATTVLQSQHLVHPKSLRLTAVEEEIIRENLSVIEANGFKVRIDDSGDYPVGERCQLLALPLSREITFTPLDLEELVSILGEEGWAASSGAVPRPSKVRKMLAMRACRSSIMIGKSLAQKQMEKIVGHMGELDKPWNCPHGRPTMRHLCGLKSWNKRGWRELDAPAELWAKYAREAE